MYRYKLKCSMLVLSSFFLFCNVVKAWAFDVPANIAITKQGEEAAKLLGIEKEVARFIELKNKGQSNPANNEYLQLQLAIIRKVMTTGFELRTVSAKLDREIIFERQALDKLTRQRDFAVAATNNVNFLQLGILSMIIDGPLEQSSNANNVLYGNRTNIVSGLMVGGLAGLAFLEQKGGIRQSPAQTNMLAQPLGLNPPDEKTLPPLLWNYLNSTPPDSQYSLTRREQLIEYWKTAKVLSININKPSTVEKVCVLGASHHKWCETIKLISNRITMLFDLRAMVDLLDAGLVDLLQILD